MRGNVLVVDDQPLPRTALANELREGGFAVREATNGCDGWEQFCEAAPDIVITDLVMPAMDGLNSLEFGCTRNRIFGARYGGKHRRRVQSWRERLPLDRRT